MIAMTKERLEELFPDLKSIKTEGWREKIYQIWNEALTNCNWDSLEDINMSSTLYMINFVKHINSTTKSALAMADSLSSTHGYEIDRDLLIAIANLHDVSKVLEYDPDDGEKGMKKSELGKYYQHGLYGGFLAEKYGLPAAVGAGIVCHTSHTDSLPRDIEAVLVAYADLADADTHRLTYGGKLHLTKYKKG